MSTLGNHFTMKLKLFVAMLAVSALIGCTRKSDLELRTEEYDVIKEGTADGLSDDLGVTQVAPLTDTDVDTTTSFSILGTDAPAGSTALPDDPALASRLGGAVTTAPSGPVGAPPSARAPVSRTPSDAADVPPTSRPAEPARRATQPPPASTPPSQTPREPAPTRTIPEEPPQEPEPQPEPPAEPAPDPDPTPPTTTRTDTAPTPEPTEPAPDPPPSDDPSLEDSPSRR